MKHNRSVIWFEKWDICWKVDISWKLGYEDLSSQHGRLWGNEWTLSASEISDASDSYHSSRIIAWLNSLNFKKIHRLIKYI